MIIIVNRLCYLYHVMRRRRKGAQSMRQWDVGHSLGVIGSYGEESGSICCSVVLLHSQCTERGDGTSVYIYSPLV